MFGFLFGSKHKRVINRISKTVDQINSLESSFEQLNADDLLAKSNELKDQVNISIKNIEKKLEFNFGGGDHPLLVSVRSGSRASMPGMMDTVLNLGLNDKTVIDLSNASNDKRFALDSYRRFIQMYSDIVLGVPHSDFEEILEEEKISNNVMLDTELSEESLEQLVKKYKEYVKETTKKDGFYP